jgi:predicted NBD/HSP70 family sugar kinase
MRKINLSRFTLATSETARDINRRVVLNFLRKHEPISRADLARHTGLQCSTVSLIIEDLIAGQWVTEGALTDLPRGRKPRLLHFNTDRKRIAGIDIRPSRTSIGVADLNGRFLMEDFLKTDLSPDAFIASLCKYMKTYLDSHPNDYAGIGLVVPGRVELTAQRLAFAPNLGWRNVDIRTPLENATGLPVTIESAPNACAMAEIWFGQHPDDVQDLVAVAVSEGCGAGIVMNNQLVLGPTGLAGEFGHVSIDPNGPLCGCGKTGCWEVFASNKAALRYYAEETGSRRRSKASSSTAVSTFDDLLLAADLGNPSANQALRRQAFHLGQGMAMIATALAPKRIVVVGEITRVWDRVDPVIQQSFRERIQPHLPTQVVPTNDTVHPRLRGAIAVVLHSHLGAPLLA